MEPKPYRAPEETKPLANLAVTKRAIGLAVTLLLTPPALAIAVIGSCKIAEAVPGDLGLFIVLGGPFAALCAVLMSILATSNRLVENREREIAVDRILSATPIAVGLCYVVGWVIGIVVFFVVSDVYVRRGLNPDDSQLTGMKAAKFAFWVPPGIALVVMLSQAWIAATRPGPTKSETPR
jgi:hypothetical protein